MISLIYYKTYFFAQIYTKILIKIDFSPKFNDFAGSPGELLRGIVESFIIIQKLKKIKIKEFFITFLMLVNIVKKCQKSIKETQAN